MTWPPQLTESPTATPGLAAPGPPPPQPGDQRQVCAVSSALELQPPLPTKLSTSPSLCPTDSFFTQVQIPLPKGQVDTVHFC